VLEGLNMARCGHWTSLFLFSTGARNIGVSGRLVHRTYCHTASAAAKVQHLRSPLTAESRENPYVSVTMEVALRQKPARFVRRPLRPFGRAAVRAAIVILQNADRSVRL
jgi:hypothetical protein